MECPRCNTVMYAWGRVVSRNGKSSNGKPAVLYRCQKCHCTRILEVSQNKQNGGIFNIDNNSYGPGKRPKLSKILQNIQSIRRS